MTRFVLGTGSSVRARRAKPALYHVPYCLPQWTPRTYLALARSLLSGRIASGPDVGRLAAELSALFHVPVALLHATGKAALETALHAVGVRPGDEVLVPTLCCPDVVLPILAQGATPALVDIGPELNLTPETVAAGLGPRARAVVVPSLFGNPADLPAIVGLAAARGLAIVDDAAQALGATLGEDRLGAFGSAGILSFGNGKVCFGTGGGVLLSRDPEVGERASGVPHPQAGVGATLARAGHVLATRRWRRWTFPLRRLVRKGGSSTPGLAPTYRRERMANLDAAVARTLLSGLENNVEARRQRVRWYGELLADVPGVALVPHRAGSACTKQVVLLDPARGEAPAEALAAFLDAAGYEVAPAYRPLHLVDGYRELSRGHLRTAESVAGRLLELPTEPSVSSLDIERLCGLVRAWAMA